MNVRHIYADGMALVDRHQRLMDSFDSKTGGRMFTTADGLPNNVVMTYWQARTAGFGPAPIAAAFPG